MKPPSLDRKIKRSAAYADLLEVTWAMRMAAHLGETARAEAMVPHLMDVFRDIIAETGATFEAIYLNIIHDDLKRWMASPLGKEHNEKIKGKNDARRSS